MERHEGSREAIPGSPPLGSLADEPVRDVAERTVRAAQSSPDEVRELTDDRSAGVVDADQPGDPISHSLGHE